MKKARYCRNIGLFHANMSACYKLLPAHILLIDLSNLHNIELLLRLKIASRNLAPDRQKMTGIAKKA